MRILSANSMDFINGSSSGFIKFDNYEDAKRFSDHVDVVQKHVDYERALYHKSKVEQEWEEKIQDYVEEHYPTQAVLSAESTSEKGLREREAMKTDSVLKEMREKAKAATDKAREASYAALEKLEEANDNAAREIKELAKTLSDKELDDLYEELRKKGDDMEVVLYDEIENRQAAREIKRQLAIEQEQKESEAKCRPQDNELLEAVNSGDKGRIKKAKEALTKALLENGVGNARLRDLLRIHKPSRKKDDKRRDINKAVSEVVEAAVKTLESEIEAKLAEVGLKGVHLEWNDDHQAWWLSADKASPYYDRIERMDGNERWIFEFSIRDDANSIPPVTKYSVKKLAEGIKAELTPSAARRKEASEEKGGSGNSVWDKIDELLNMTPEQIATEEEKGRKEYEAEKRAKIQKKFDAEKEAFKNSKNNEYADVLRESKTPEEAAEKFRQMAAEKRAVAEDWNSRKYKKSNEAIESHDIYGEEKITTISAANERRRKAAINNALEAAKDYDDFADTILKRCGLSKDSGKLRFQKAESEQAKAMGREKALRDEVVGTMRKAGLDVSMDTEGGQRVLDEANGKAKLSAKKRRALETASVPHDEKHQPTVVSSADGAKILKELDSTIENYENRANRPKTFLGDIAKALGAAQDGSASEYATFETKNGRIVTIRLSNHNATTSNFDHRGESEGISIVVSSKGNLGMTNDGAAHVVEYYYDAIKLRRADGKPLADIVRSIKQALYSDEFTDTTGLAERQEVNAEDVVRYNKVYHGSGADFDHFDHSHMGEGEGAQVFGWGTYVTEVEGIGRTYAEQNSKMFDHPVVQKMVARMQDAMADGKTFEEAKREALERMRPTYEKTKGDNEKYSSFNADYEKLEHLTEKDFQNRHLYTVEIPDDTGENYLDWDGKLSKNIDKENLADKVLELLSDDMDEIEMEMLLRDLQDSMDEVTTGKGLYKTLAQYVGDKRASGLLHEAGFVGIKYPADYLRGGRKDGKKNYVIFNEADAKITDHVRFFRTKDGEAYGFTIGGKIYIDPRIANAETPVHEYAHLWATALRKGNAEEWKNVVGLMKDTKVWDEVRKRYPELKDDNDIADEVLATYSGRRGAERLRAEMDNADGKAKGALARMKEAIRKFWKATADMLHIHYTSAEEVADRVMKDLLDGVDPRKLSDDSGSRETSSSRNSADPIKGMEKAAEKYREEQKLKLQKKDSEEDELFVSLQNKKGVHYRVEEEPLPTVWLPKEEYAKLSSAIHTNGRYENGKVGSEFTDNNFYLYTYRGDGRFDVNMKLPIEGNEDLIDILRKGTENGTIRSAADITGVVENRIVRPDEYNNNYASSEGQRGSDEGFGGLSPLRQSHERRGDERVASQLSQSASAEHISKTIEKTAQQTGGKVKQVHSVDQIENEQVRKDIEDGKEVTGWYDEKTGEVHLYMPNIHDSYTAAKTIWHETVGHKGMRGLLGDKFHTYLRSLWMDMDSPVFEELHKYVKERMAKEPLSTYDAIEEFIADAAEKGKGEPGFWNNVKNKVVDALHEIGYRLCPNVKDVKYMLWLAKNVQKHGNDPVWKMRADAVKWKIEHEKTEYTTTEGGEIRSIDGKPHGFESMTKAEWDEATDGQVHYRTSPSAATAIDRYHRMLARHGYMAIESFADNMASVDRLMRAIDPTIKKIEDVSAGMNPYMLRTVLDGTASEKMQRFEADVMQPLDKYMARMIDAVDGKNAKEKIRNFNLYMIKKHGLERNRVFFVRDAVKNMDEAKRKQTLADFNTKRKALGDQLRKGGLMLSQYYEQLDEWICNNVNKDYKAGEHDYSGMHGMYDIADKKTPYNDIQVQDEVMSVERAMEGMETGSVEKFWGQVKVATQFSLDEDYQNGFVTKANHESVSGMFDWYVPLRKFDEETAEDVYGYVTEMGDSKTAIGPAIVKAKGRKSLSETNILAQIGAMANYAVVRGAQNKLKLIRIVNRSLSVVSIQVHTAVIVIFHAPLVDLYPICMGGVR